MTKGQSLREGAAWVFASNTGHQVLSFLFGVALARLLAPDDFGMLLTIQVFTGLAGFVSGGGMGQALVRAKTVSRADVDVVFTLQLFIGLVIYSIFWTVAPSLGRWYGNPLYADLLRVSALSFLVRPFHSLPSNLLYRQARYKAQTGVALSTLCVSSAVSIGMAWAGFGVWSLIWGGLAGSLVSIAMLVPLSGWRPGLSGEFRRAREMARYGVLVSSNDLVGYLQTQASIFILSRTLGPGAVGLFNKGNSLASMPHGFITASVYSVLFREMAVQQDNLDRSQYLFLKSLTLVAVYATPFYVGLLWLAEPLVVAVYGPRWAESAGPLMILSLAWPLWLVDNLSGAVLSARNWLGRELPVQVAMLVVTALCIVVALPHGIDGVAWAIVTASAYRAGHLYWLACASLRLRLRACLPALMPAAALNTVLAAALATTQHALDALQWDRPWAILGVMIGVGAVVYGVCALAFPIPALAGERARWLSRLRLISKE